jgi:RNA ligase (TIGR02306 family)
MANWKVSIESITLLVHPNADSLELVNAGDRQFVTQKGLYKTGDKVVVVPEKSMLPDELAVPFLKYLGKDNRVKSTKLRGELSEGILLPIPEGLEDIAEGEDISEKLGIIEFHPKVPLHLAGDVEASQLSRKLHDCEQFRLYQEEFEPDELVVVTEKIHGTQLNLSILSEHGDTLKVEVTSKGLGRKDIVLKPNLDNFYWKAVTTQRLIAKTLLAYPNNLVQIIGEAIPCQKGFTYGVNHLTPTVTIFKIIVDGVNVPFLEIYNKSYPDGTPYWPTVPLLYYGKFSELDVSKFVDGDSNYGILNGNQTIKEGIVISPAIPRMANRNRNDLYLKIVSDAYMKKSYTGEEFN